MKIQDNLYWYSKDKPVTMFIGHGGTCNVFAIDQGDEIWLIDTGIEILGRAKRILNYMKQDGLDPQKITKIFLTHIHPDHFNGANVFNEKFHPVFYTHQEDKPLVDGGDKAFWQQCHDAARGLMNDFFGVPQNLAEFGSSYCFGKMPLGIPMTYFQDGDVYKGSRYNLQVIHTPGHTLGHSCFFIASLGVLFVGDIIDPYFDHKANLNLPYSDYDLYYTSLQRLKKLDIKVFCAAHAHKIYSNPAVNQELIDGTLKNLDYAKSRTIELLKSTGPMRIKDFKGKFPSKIWQFQDQAGVPFAVIKSLEKQNQIKQDGKKFLYIGP